MMPIRPTDELTDSMLGNVSGGALRTATAHQDDLLRKSSATQVSATTTVLVAPQQMAVAGH